MSFSISFFARDVHSAQTKLRDCYAPASVKAVVELALAGIPQQPQISVGAGSSSSAGASDSARGANQATPRKPQLCGILVETHGHIDEHGGRSGINSFRVEPYYD